ncbi:hypothetical protein V6N11_065197 [Hibiscus sabdariffa]|uniref:Uncharacterized protein n=1 Tax=Hibiscus sabdariffa TaxID=183260 RepID=A0ABR2QG82_9ROSI
MWNYFTAYTTPQWNGVSKRRNRTLLHMVQSLMSHSDLPTYLWGHALETTTFTLNCVPSKSVQKTPYEIWTGKRPGMSFMKKGNGRNIELEEVRQQRVDEPEVEQISQVVEENSTDLETQPLRRSTRKRHVPKRYGFHITTHGDIILVDQDESKTYQDVVSSPDSKKWLEAMRSEMDSMPVNKGRLVAKGFQKIHGVDYDETFSPVAMFKPIRILLAIAAFHDYEIWQMDVKTAFLNGKLKEDVYMTQPEGFVAPCDKKNPREPLYALDPETEKTQHRLRRGIRVLIGDHNSQNPVDGQNPSAPAIGTVRDYLAEDLDGLNPAVTIPEFEDKHFELKPVMFNMLNTLGQFGGSPVENARQHLQSFLEICNSFKIHGVSNDVLKMKLFPYSLMDKAKDWLNNLPPGSFKSWTELCRSFLAKLSYNNLTDRLRSEITSFRQEDDEAMHEA